MHPLAACNAPVGNGAINVLTLQTGAHPRMLASTSAAQMTPGSLAALNLTIEWMEAVSLASSEGEERLERLLRNGTSGGGAIVHEVRQHASSTEGRCLWSGHWIAAGKFFQPQSPERVGR